MIAILHLRAASLLQLMAVWKWLFSPYPTVYQWLSLWSYLWNRRWHLPVGNAHMSQAKGDQVQEDRFREWWSPFGVGFGKYKGNLAVNSVYTKIWGEVGIREFDCILAQLCNGFLIGHGFVVLTESEITLPVHTFAVFSAPDTRLIAFAVLFSAAWFAACAAFLHLDGVLADDFAAREYFVAIVSVSEWVVAVEAVAVFSTGQPGSKTLTIQFYAFRVAAITSSLLCLLLSVDHFLNSNNPNNFNSRASSSCPVSSPHSSLFIIISNNICPFIKPKPHTSSPNASLQCMRIWRPLWSMCGLLAMQYLSSTKMEEVSRCINEVLEEYNANSKILSSNLTNEQICERAMVDGVEELAKGMNMSVFYIGSSFSGKEKLADGTKS